MLKTTNDDYLKRLFKARARNGITAAEMKSINANKDYKNEKLIKKNRLKFGK